MKDVGDIYKSGLCCSCGLCGGFCKQSAVTYKIDKLGFYYPVVDDQKCVNCGVCLRHCPGINDLKNYEAAGDQYCYGYSCDNEMRLNASSGGITTELLCYLIEKKYVDYVTCVTGRDEDRLPKQVITNSISEIRRMRGSKYCPVNWNDVEKKLESLEGTVAVVALPCQINALKSYFRNRKSSIKYYISLLCNHTPSIFASNFLAYYRSGNSRFSITYRGSGWPGYTTIVAKRGRKKISWRLKFRKMWRTGFGKYFKTKRCIICNDPFAKNADVVMGDSYFLQDRDAIGSTFCIVRSIEIWNILKEMHHEGIINIKNGPEIHQINESYKSLFNREQIFEKRNMILKKMRHAYVKTSSGSGKDIKVSIKDILRFKKTLFVSQLGRYKWLWKILAEKNNMASEIENL